MLESGSDSPALPARKSEALLAILAIRPGVTLGREKLISLLWPEVPEPQGRTSLRQALGHLRKVLSPEAVVSTADKVYLDPARVWADTAELERLLRFPPAEREALGDVWRGSLLDGFSGLEDGFDEWLADERRRLSERVALGLEECLAALSARGQPERAITVGMRLVEIEPARESVHRALMRLYAEIGDRSAALRQYERCRELLERYFQVGPSEETEHLRNRIAETRSEPADAKPPSVRHLAPKGGLTLAVLPFTAPETEAARLLARGLTEDVTTELSRFRQLAVIFRGSMEQLALRGASPDEIAAETGARLLLTGSVRMAGARARVTALLVDTTTALQIWAERWDIPHDDPFVAVDRLTQNVVSALALRIDEAQLSLSRQRPRERLDAYECWLRGLECVRRGTPHSDEEARAFFEQALARSPDFARAYAGISLSHFNDWSCQAWERWDERERLAFENARRAVELDDSDHLTHCILGRIYVYRRQFELGQRHLEQALTLNPNDADALIHASVAYTLIGEPERASELSQTALRLNPRHPDWYYPCAAASLFFMQRFDESVGLLSRAPDAFVDTRAMLAAATALLGAREPAVAHAERFRAEFCAKITRGRQPEAGEPLRWLLHVNPLRRAADTELLLQGLSEAGIRAD